MTLLIVIVLVVFLPMIAVWWIDVTVEDEFYDSFKREYPPTAPELRSAAETKTPLYESGTDFSAKQSHCPSTPTV